MCLNKWNSYLFLHFMLCVLRGTAVLWARVVFLLSCHRADWCGRTGMSNTNWMGITNGCMRCKRPIASAKKKSRYNCCCWLADSIGRWQDLAIRSIIDNRDGCCLYTGRHCVRPTEYESWLFIHLKLVYHFQIHLYALQFSRRCLRFFK